jgi:hypothetical protein
LGVVLALAVVEPAVEALAVVEPVVAEALVEPVAEALAVVELVAEALAVVEPVREQELVPGEEREVAAAVAVMLSKILTSVHTDCLTRPGSAQECFRFKGATRVGLFKGAIGVGLVAAGLLTALLIGSTNTRPSLVGMCGGTRRACAIFSGLTRLSG